MPKRYIVLMQGNKLEDAYNYLKTYSNGWWKHTPNSMIINTEKSAVQIRDELKTRFSLDKVIVIELSGVAAWAGISESGSQWLKNNL